MTMGCLPGRDACSSAGTDDRGGFSAPTSLLLSREAVAQPFALGVPSRLGTRFRRCEHRELVSGARSQRPPAAAGWPPQPIPPTTVSCSPPGPKRSIPPPSPRPVRPDASAEAPDASFHPPTNSALSSQSPAAAHTTSPRHTTTARSGLALGDGRETLIGRSPVGL